MTTAADLKPRANEHIIDLPNGRKLEYAEGGNATSRVVFLFFSGLLSVGSVSEIPPAAEKLDAHFLAPSPTGMGRTSPRDPATPYHLNLIADTRALLEHTHPDGVDALYLGGGSYGTVLAQMIYGAPYDLFPQGRSIRAVLLLAGFSPFKYHDNYAKCLSWPTYLSVGPPSTLPGRVLQRLFSTVLASKLRTVEGARGFLDQTLFDKMEPAERAVMDAWLAKGGRTYDQFITSMAENNVRSVADTWDGFMEVSDVLHSDWGFDPHALDADHAKPALVVSGDADDMGGATNKWIADNYPNATFRTVPGGHIAGIFHMDELWEQLVALGEDAKQAA
ncbi:hypothetical protein CspeluHIS016_0600910 [Cutaneotrichosporon spelunceum]|uniref:AB hydrolase-1 domain-containing protein n=1 Tax=Cutaneotrichosporon spelunceum TaxID=1672016 RepID=A0AAD3TXI7_9TREE|nr:hypothetical protein CspeluHIS016_0600910 [Cutaneotrichosporon spelunceum]